jgi:hypothetical protein
MSKLNPSGAPRTVHSVAAKNKLEVGISANGNVQFVKLAHQMLYELLVTTLFGKGNFYKTSDQIVTDVKTSLKQVMESNDPNKFDFIANLAIHTRGEMNLRTIPIVLVVEFAAALRQCGQSYEHMRQLVCDVIQRADQITDLYSYALNVFGSKNKMPMAIKRGVADAFNKFGEYNFGKYNRAGSVKFRDVLRIVHPVAKNAQQGEIFKKIMEDKLAVPYTWETELSVNGQLPLLEQKSKTQLWTELVESNKVGYMALLRNLRNICEAKVSAQTIRSVCSVIADPERVATSRQLPFDFVEAYSIVASLDTKMATAVSKAIDLSVGNLPKLGERVWIVVDYSGSMGHDPFEADENRRFWGSSSSVSAISTATLLAAALIKSSGDTTDNLAVTLFGSDAKQIPPMDTNQSIVRIKCELLKYRTGKIAGSTNFGAAMEQYNNLGFVPDTIIVLTDGEVNGFPFSRLTRIGSNKQCMKIAINMQGAPTTPFAAADGWYSFAGWSPALFKWVPAMRNKQSVVDQLSVPYNTVSKKTDM